MNRRPDAPDSLSPEERELAQRLLRLGPNDGPSPALDARILAAAHAAVAQEPRLRARPKQRWPMWIGVAASLSLAVGVAWQLRPAATTMEAAQQEHDVAVVARAQVKPVADSGGGQSAEAQAEAAAPAAASAADSVAAPAMPAELSPGSSIAADSAADAAAPAAMKPAPVVAEAAPPAPPAPPMVIAQDEAAKRSRAEAPASVQAAAASEARASEPLRRAKAAPAEREFKAAPAMAPPPPPAPPAPMGVMSAPAPADAAPAANAGWASPADNLSSKHAAKASAAAAANAATLGKAEAYSERADIQAAPEPSSQSNASPTLDRVEVTGSRIGSDTSDESRLTPGEWLDRIRGYRDAGEAERARESLQRFRRAHPHARVPDDLRALLK
jgi:hypothetical protein